MPHYAIRGVVKFLRRKFSTSKLYDIVGSTDSNRRRISGESKKVPAPKCALLDGGGRAYNWKLIFLFCECWDGNVRASSLIAHVLLCNWRPFSMSMCGKLNFRAINSPLHFHYGSVSLPSPSPHICLHYVHCRFGPIQHFRCLSSNEMAARNIKRNKSVDRRKVVRTFFIFRNFAFFFSVRERFSHVIAPDIYQRESLNWAKGKIYIF